MRYIDFHILNGSTYHKMRLQDKTDFLLKHPKNHLIKFFMKTEICNLYPVDIFQSSSSFDISQIIRILEVSTRVHVHIHVVVIVVIIVVVVIIAVEVAEDVDDGVEGDQGEGGKG